MTSAVPLLLPCSLKLRPDFFTRPTLAKSS